MKLRNYQTMDPHLLLGIVNMTLRNDASDLEDLARQHDLDEVLLAARLHGIGYAYDPHGHQFVAKPDPG